MVIDCETHLFPYPRKLNYERCYVEDQLEDMNRCGGDRTFLTFYSASTLAPTPVDLTNPSVKRLADSDAEVWDYFKESWAKRLMSLSPATRDIT